MPLVIRLNEGPYVLPDTYCDKEDLEDIQEVGVLVVLAEDITSLLEDMANVGEVRDKQYEEHWVAVLRKLIKSIEWQESEESEPRVGA